MLLHLIIVSTALLRASTDAQMGSNTGLPYGLLSGYGMDMCRYMSCPYGQQCLNGVCHSSESTDSTIPSFVYSNNAPYTSTFSNYYGTSPLIGTGVGGPPYQTGGFFGGSNMLNKFCTSNLDCLPGSSCLYGRCTYGNNGLMLGGTRPCSVLQQCLNGQICVNGFCTQSNVFYTGSQNQPLLTSCSTGAPCPIGHYCMNGFCTRNSLTSTFACSHGVCPPNMVCQMGRCTPFGGRR